jgi:signal transduction histidine kinase/DNA-binding response OmpR family regulator
MKQTKSTSGIKKKIVGGFLLLLTLVFLAIFSVIQLATKLAPPDPGISTSAIKLTLTSNLLSSIIEADGQARAYISTGDSKYLDAYYEQQRKSNQIVDSLERGSISNTGQFLKMVAVDSLLRLKEATYSNYFELRQNVLETGAIDFTQLSARIKDTIITIPDKRINKTVTQQISQREQPKKKGFFPKIWNNITGKKKSDTLSSKGPELIVKYDTVTTYRTTIEDNTVSQVKAQLRRYEQQKNLQKQLLAERELMLVQADQDIMNEIRAVLLLFEKEEISKAITETEKNHKLLDNLWKTALILAGAGLLTTIGFLILIWKDLAKSAFYRKQSEEARTLAESLLKVKEQFLANMSHEIRTPLTSIIGFTERLTNTPVTNEQSRYLKYISSSSEHLLELINDLLDFSKIDSGKLPLEIKAFDPEELFLDAYETIASRASEKGIETIIRQNVSNLILKGDPLRLRQIVINLLSNSLKFTEKGKIVLQTKAQLLPDNKYANLIIRVADTGIGIPEDKLNYIFEEFSQVDHSITRRFGGSGLGLAITKKLVEMMNGTINVVSRELQGTIFTVRLKVPVSSESIKSNLLPETVRDLKGINILVAEDDPTTQILLEEFLKSYNTNLSITSSGIEAYNLFIEKPDTFDIVATDIQMPGLSGIELVKLIKETCEKRKIKSPVIIGLTAHADSRDFETFKAAGMDHFILKPFRNKDLKAIFNTISLPDKPAKESNDPVTVTNNIGTAEINNSTSLDLSSFRKFAGNDENSLNRIIISLNENLEKTLDQMKVKYQEKDFHGLSVLAHRLQPNIKLLGVADAAAILRELEVISRNETPDDDVISEKLQVTSAHIKRIQVELQKIAIPG